MNERRSDFELLRHFSRNGAQDAFAELVRRHLDLVYATALRKVEDPGGAEEIGQNVFTILARKAWQFGPDDSVPAWLYKTALLESKQWWRGELRRRRREQTAIELGTTMNLPDDRAAAQPLLPLLDEGLRSLREKDRVALLLRYYEKRPLRDVGSSIGVSEDTAQKRVAAAVEKLAAFFQRRGFRSATLAGTAALLEGTAASTPASTAAVVVTTALKNTSAVTGLAALLSRFTALTKAQTAALCVLLVVAPATWQWRNLLRGREAASRAELLLSDSETDLNALELELTNLRQSVLELENRKTANANQLAQAAAAQSSFEQWKRQLRERLLAPDFRWTDDSPFVRIPKSLLRQFDINNPISRPGVVSQAARELLGLTPQQRERLESALHGHMDQIENLAQFSAYETNLTTRVHVPSNAVASKMLVLPPLGDSANSSAEQLQTAFRETLGQDRWALVEPLWNERGTATLQRVLELDASHNEQELAVWLADDAGTLLVKSAWGMQYASTSSEGIPLDLFLPGATNQTITLPAGNTLELAPADRLGLEAVPQVVKQQLVAWLQQQAADRLKQNP